jgi:catalase
MPVLDTSTTALARQRETFRRMTPEQRVALAAEMSDEIRAVTEAGIRQRHPAYTDDDVRAALAAIVLGGDDATRHRAGRISPGG